MVRIIHAILVMALLSSCTAKRIPIQYLEQEFDTTLYNNYNWRDLTIKTGDILSIEIKSDNAEAASIYNQGGGLSTPTSSTSSVINPSATFTEGYLVNRKGIISISGLGPIDVLGKTRDQVANLVVKELNERNLLKNPIVEVRLKNFKITISGEVNNPGEVLFDEERVNLLQALARAGDLNKTARRDIITIIRERDGRRSFAKVNLNEATVFNSAFFQLEQNDMVIVPSRFKRDQEEANIIFRYITVGLSTLNLIALLLINIF